MNIHRWNRLGPELEHGDIVVSRTGERYQVQRTYTDEYALTKDGHWIIHHRTSVEDFRNALKQLEDL